jgi:hypothetical protein
MFLFDFGDAPALKAAPKTAPTCSNNMKVVPEIVACHQVSLKNYK